MLVIIPCGSKKLKKPASAWKMYTGPYFKACLRYALSIAAPQDCRILSAKYGLLELEQEIQPYDIRMGDKGSIKADDIADQLSTNDVICLGGNDYTSIIEQLCPDASFPLRGVGGIGKQMQWLKNHRGRLA